MSTIQAGTIIHGTLRPQDLIPAFLDTIRNVDEGVYLAIVDNYGGDFIARCCHPSGLGYTLTGEIDRQDSLLEDLFTALEDIAPEGLTFGTCEGDGSDFGFWPIEDEEY